MENTIMTEKIARRGVKTPDSYEPDILEKITAGQVIKENALVLSEDNSIKEVREFLNEEQNYTNNYFIVSNNEGEYRGTLSSLTLFDKTNNVDSLIGTLVKHKHVSIANNNSLRTAVELMAKENIDVLPVLSKENESIIIGVLSYHDIISAYKYKIDEHERQRPNISIKQGGLKILLRGKKLITAIKKH